MCILISLTRYLMNTIIHIIGQSECFLMLSQVDILTVIFDVIINIQSFKLVITPNRPEKTIKLLLLFYFIIVNYFVTIKVLHQGYI